MGRTSRKVMIDNEYTLIRMNQFIEKQPNGCTKWKGGKDRHGYAFFSRYGKMRIASRVLWELVKGPIPPKLVIRHKCDNPQCLNIEHLELGTQAQNLQDARDRGRLK